MPKFLIASIICYLIAFPSLAQLEKSSKENIHLLTIDEIQTARENLSKFPQEKLADLGIVEVILNGRIERINKIKHSIDENINTTIKKSFDAVLGAYELDPKSFNLIVEDARPFNAYAEFDNTIIVTKALGLIDEGARRFILAHELAHAKLKHFNRMISTYKHYIKNDVREETMRSLPQSYTRTLMDNSLVSEFEADKLAILISKKLNISNEDMQNVILKGATPVPVKTHPSHIQRLHFLNKIIESNSYTWEYALAFYEMFDFI